MFDPNIKVRVIADFKYKDESYLVANSHLSFDIYDSMKIAELVTLYSPAYEYKDHLELPSIESLPYHVKEQVIDTYKFDKPLDANEFLPISEKPSYEIGGDTYTPFGYSPYESDIETNIKPIADSVVIVETSEPTFPEIDSTKPSVVEDKIETLIPSITIKSELEDVITIEAKTLLESDNEEQDKPLVYNIQTTTILSLSKEELQDKSANDLKKALLEINPSYDYTNKVEAIKYLLTIK